MVRRKTNHGQHVKKCLQALVHSLLEPVSPRKLQKNKLSFVRIFLLNQPFPAVSASNRGKYSKVLYHQIYLARHAPRKLDELIHICAISPASLQQETLPEKHWLPHEYFAFNCGGAALFCSFEPVCYNCILLGQELIVSIFKEGDKI